MRPEHYVEEELGAYPEDGVIPTKRDIAFDTVAGIDADPALGFQLRGHSCNPLVDAAQPLLGLAIRIRKMDACGDVRALQDRVRNQLAAIDAELRGHGYESGVIAAYSYCLCTFLDEAVMATAWGSQSVWAQHSLLSACHNETWGGEKFYSITARMLTQPEHFRDPLEFIYVCLCLGFKGRYQVEQGGSEALNGLIGKLHRILRHMRGAAPEVLVQDDGAPVQRRYRLARHLPSWSPWLVAAGLLSLAYAVYSFHLRAITTDVMRALDTLLAAT